MTEEQRLLAQYKATEIEINRELKRFPSNWKRIENLSSFSIEIIVRLQEINPKYNDMTKAFK